MPWQNDWRTSTAKPEYRGGRTGLDPFNATGQSIQFQLVKNPYSHVQNRTARDSGVLVLWRWDKLWAKRFRPRKLSFKIMFLHDFSGNLPLRHNILFLRDFWDVLWFGPNVSPNSTFMLAALIVTILVTSATYCPRAASAAVDLSLIPAHP